MRRLLWLDDIRNPYKDRWLFDYAPEYVSDENNVIWAKSFKDFTEWILLNGLPNKIAFDHDLGEDVAKGKVADGMSKRQARIQKRETMSGFDCAKWLVEYCIDYDVDLPKWVIQSANPVGKENIDGLLSNYRKQRINDNRERN